MENETVVRIKGLSKTFKELHILKDVNLEIHKAENVVVLGKSGSGKSTLIKCMIGLVEPDEGEIRVFGEDISAMNYRELNELRKRMGFLFQSAALYDSM